MKISRPGIIGWKLPLFHINWLSPVSLIRIIFIHILHTHIQFRCIVSLTCNTLALLTLRGRFLLDSFLRGSFLPLLLDFVGFRRCGCPPREILIKLELEVAVIPNRGQYISLSILLISVQKSKILACCKPTRSISPHTSLLVSNASS